MLRSMVVISKGIMCSICVYSRVFPAVGAGRELLCAVWFSFIRISDWDRLVLSRGDPGCRS